tara:strand:+ start:379 stop:969 length:591 start_codon:yes stop_codon:yes gene_type:complete
MKKYTALFCRKDSDYKLRKAWDVYDVRRDAFTFDKNVPVVCHPPCRFWGKMSHLAGRSDKMTIEEVEREKSMAPWSLDKVRKLGGVVEHPSSSKLFKDLSVGVVDSYGGFIIEIDQYDFGHVAHKDTKLYIAGLDYKDLPPLPPKDNSIHYDEKGQRRSIAGNVPGTIRCTQKQREYTPGGLIDWFEKVLDKIQTR